MKVLVCGDREWNDVEMISTVLMWLPVDSIVVHGACKGADRIGGVVAEALGFQVRPYPARWNMYGRGAGPIRNQEMLTKEHLPNEPFDLAIAFHDDLEKSVGTRDMVTRIVKAKIRWWHIAH